MVDISVIIPTFRRPAQLAEALESVFAQDGSFEIIVLDDSPEGSARGIVQQYADPRLTYVLHDPPSGGRPALVRNRGWPLARGHFVHFLDDDDRVASGYYRSAVDTFNTNPQIGVVFGRIEPFAGPRNTGGIDHERHFFEGATRRARRASRLGSRRRLVAALLFDPTFLVNSACMVRRECIAPLDGYDVTLGLTEDVDFYCRAIRMFGAHFLDQVAVYYRINADSLMHSRRDDTLVVDAYEKMHARYRAAHGWLEFLTLKVLARSVLKVTWWPTDFQRNWLSILPRRL